MGEEREAEGRVDRRPTINGRCLHLWSEQGRRGEDKDHLNTTLMGGVPHLQWGVGWVEILTFINQYTKICTIILLYIYQTSYGRRLAFYVLALVLLILYKVDYGSLQLRDRVLITCHPRVVTEFCM